MLRAAGADEAKVLILAIDDEDECLSIIESCRKHFPNLKLLARACSRDHAFLLHEVGGSFFIEQLGSSLECASAALVELGNNRAEVDQSAEEFRKHELSSIDHLAPLRGDEKSYVSAIRQNLKDLDSLLENSPKPE